VFVVRAFKHALFGTPQAVTPAPNSFKQSEKPKATASESSLPSKSSSTRQLQPSDKQTQKENVNRYLDRANASFNDFGEDISSTKLAGILMTPGTVTGRRKQVKFGEHVVNNEGKTSKYSKSGLPDNCPGKFPSPFTPKIATPANKLQNVQPIAKDTIADSKSESKSESKFKEILVSPKQADVKQQSVSRTRDDSDITSDLNLPLSSSGRYWKEQYDIYSARSEAEMKRLITKNKIAKDYARMKDEEAAVWKSRHDIARMKHEKLVTSLEQQIKDFRERLRITSAENAKVKTELALMKKAYEDIAAKSNLIENRQESKVKSQPASEDEQINQIQLSLALKGIKNTSTREIRLDGETPRSRQLTRRMGRSELRATQPNPSRRTQMAQKSTSSFDSIISDEQDPLHTLKPLSQPTNPSVTPLGERNLNIVSTPPSRKLKGLSATTKPPTDPINEPNKFDPLGKISHATIMKLAETVPLEGLDMQASQPTTPQVSKSGSVKARIPRSSGGSKMADKRRQDAKARIAARRTGKNAASSRVWV
jgi:Cut12 conserved domain